MHSSTGRRRRIGLQSLSLAAAFASCGAVAHAGLLYDNITPTENGSAASNGSTGFSTTAANDTYIGGGFTLLTGATDITGLDIVGENTSTTNFTSVEVTIYIWGTVNTGTVSASNPAFSNELFGGSFIYDEPVAAGGYIDLEDDPGVLPGVTFSTPIPIPNASSSTTSTIGVTVNYKGAVGGSTTSYTNVTGLTSLLAVGAAPSPGSNPLNGFYRNNNGEVNGNFTGPIRNANNSAYINLAARIYGDLPAVNYQWNSSTGGNWEDNTKWNPNGEPTVSDNASFNLNSSSGYTVAVNNNSDVCDNLNVGNDNVTIALAAANTAALTVASTLTVGQPATSTTTGTTTGTLALTSTGFGSAVDVITNNIVIGPTNGVGKLSVGNNVVVFNNFDVSVGAGSSLSLLDGSALVTNTITLAGTTNAWTGKVDITDTYLDLPGNNLAATTNQVAQGYNLSGGANWNGKGGITSSTAATDSSHLTAVGVIQNDQDGSPIYGNPNSSTLPAFGNFYPGAGDILVKYTYYGDANLDGVVDGSDYSLIDAGYASGGTLTGWLNGDFNYDGVIDGSDYALIDNAFNNQGDENVQNFQAGAAVATNEIAPLAAVPEPGSLAAASVVLTAAGLRGRRSRARMIN